MKAQVLKSFFRCSKVLLDDQMLLDENSDA